MTVEHVAWPPTPRPKTRVRPWVAAFTSLLWPGAGHFVAGRFSRGLLFAALQLDLFVVVAVLTVRPPLPGLLMYVPASIAIALDAVVAVDAWRVARVTPETSWLRRWGAAIGVLLLVSALDEPVTQLLSHRVGHTVRMSGASMEPAVLGGDEVFVVPQPPQQLHYDDIVEWRDTRGGGYLFRLAGLPGDTLEMRGGRLIRNGRAVAEPYARYGRPGSRGKPLDLAWQRGHVVRADAAGPYQPTSRTWGPLVVPKASAFVLGDDRDHSSDSRFQGFVRFDRIRGRARVVYFSFGNGEIRWDRIGRPLETRPRADV